jgi:DNA helicase-2/ATP-dependent DNA helicase PcrA
MLDGAIPSYKAFNDYEQLEEERKLFYVACSRAKENLYLTSPAYLLTYGFYFDKLSRFLIEIDQNKYNIEEYYDE